MWNVGSEMPRNLGWVHCDSSRVGCLVEWRQVMREPELVR